MVSCVRDECTYLRLSERILEGEGIQRPTGGFGLRGIHFYRSSKGLTGYGAGIKTTQAIVSVLVIGLALSLN